MKEFGNPVYRMKMNLFNLIRNWFVVMGVLTAFTILVLFVLTPDNQTFAKSIFLYLICLALLVQVVCLVKWVRIKRKFKKEMNHV